MTRRLRTVGLDFLETAPLRLVFTAEAFAPPEAVFAVLADVDGWPGWFDAVTAARPLDGGRRREVRLRGGTRLVETVLAADPAERYTYRVDGATAPGLRALLEEWRLTPAGGGTRIRYTFALDGSPPVRLAARLGRAGIGSAFRKAVRALDRRVLAEQR
ncbi:polyketide cyclase [Streptomyces albus subsp. albus]|nr:polyketide cyclase [Streptomyces albus subsp. albus]